jgi:hypothetical protein
MERSEIRDLHIGIRRPGFHFEAGQELLCLSAQ